MTPLTLAARFLEPLSQPWAVVSAVVVPADTAVWEAVGDVLELAMRLLHLLLAL